MLVLPHAPTARAIPKGLRVRTYRSGLNFVIDMAWVSGTRKLFFTEKSGRIRVMVGKRLLSRPCRRLDVNDAGERGALGIVLHPRFKRNHWLYVYYTKASPLQNRVTRFKVRNNRCRNPKHIVKRIDASSSGYHNGGQLEFVGNKLFVSTGEAHGASAAQNRRNRLGKVLRYKGDGSIPRGNPFSRPGNRNPVWSYGHRNPFGLTHKPNSKKLYETENGPSCDDEFNIIRKGRNYGWGGGYSCGTAGVGPNPKSPLRRWSNIIVPTDPWWYKGKLRKLNGDIYMGDFRNRLHRIRLNGKGTRLRFDRVIHRAPDGIVDVTKGPGRVLYFATPNTIYRIVRR
ncbi:MAG TPA: PQQ-dependent sugar dehydrogenase [Actinomycetota bacterium]|nr:PQQ-dependent sugar dehydrogenase [Actinomycetota bacterium]